MQFFPPNIPPEQLESRAVLKKLTQVRATLAELKGVSSSIPNEQIIIDTLSIQEAKESSGIENIITTHDDLYQGGNEWGQFASPEAKEVYRYVEALKYGFVKVRENGFIHLKLILEIQEIIEGNSAGVRRTPGTVLKNDLTNEIIYTPPQDYQTIMSLLDNLEKFINNDPVYDIDPLVKMALIHHQFESIHPFYDGNGRTGRIINVLYLINEGLLDLPILYISRYILRNRATYYELLQSTRVNQNWEPWIMYMLEAVESTSISAIGIIRRIKELMLEYKRTIRTEEPKMYSQDLINNLFRHPYTKIKYVERELGVSRITATRYLDRLGEMGLVKKIKRGRTSYYVNEPLFGLLSAG